MILHSTRLKNSWKKQLRLFLFNWLPPKIYLKVVPVYFKIFNKRRRACSYKFSLDNQGRYFLQDGENKFYFVDHRRLSRYMFPDGLNYIHQAMKAKYTISNCTINKGDIVVEIGSNVGEFTQFASVLAQKVYAFEPDPNCIRCLKENIINLENVEIVEMGASNENGEKKFYISSEDADSSFIIPDHYIELVNIQSIRLDSWMLSQGISQIDFLKVEAEGGELEVLEGLGEMINKVRKISVDGGPERQGTVTYPEVKQYLHENEFYTKVNDNHVYAWR